MQCALDAWRSHAVEYGQANDKILINFITPLFRDHLLGVGAYGTGSCMEAESPLGFTSTWSIDWIETPPTRLQRKKTIAPAFQVLHLKNYIKQLYRKNLFLDPSFTNNQEYKIQNVSLSHQR